MRTLTALAIATALIVSAAAQDTRSTNQGDAPKQKTVNEPTAQAKDDEKICRHVSQMGSRKKERMCLTKDQWLEFNRGE